MYPFSGFSGEFRLTRANILNLCMCVYMKRERGGGDGDSGCCIYVILLNVEN